MFENFFHYLSSKIKIETIEGDVDETFWARLADYTPSPLRLLVDHTKIEKFLDLSIQKTRFKFTLFLHKNSTFLIALFADDTSLFPVVNDVNLSEFHLNSDFKKISEWAYQWKISFNPDISKQAQEAISSRKAVKASHPAVFFNDIPVARCSTHKHLGMYLDDRPNFSHHITEKIAKPNKGIGVIKKKCIMFSHVGHF